MNNSVERLNKVFEISDLLYSREKEKSISKLNEGLEREFQSGAVTYSTLKIYFMVMLKTIKHLINCRVDFDIREINSFTEKDLEKSLSTTAFKKIRERIIQTIEEEFQYLIDKVTDFSEDHHFPNKMLEWIKEEINNEKVEILKDTKKDVEIDQKKFELKIGINDLSEEQNRDYKKHEYKCYDKIFIPGIIASYKSSYISINGKETRIGNSCLRLFMGLSIELKKGQGGWVSRDTLMNKELINPEDPNDFRKFSELRKYVEGYLLENNAFEFIKNNKNKEYRIATHPDFITYNKEKLLNHKDPKIRKLAEELP